MPKNRIRRERQANPEVEQARRDAKREDRVITAQASKFLDSAWKKLKQDSINAGMDWNEIENSMDRSAFDEGVLHLCEYATTGVLPDNPAAREAEREWQHGKRDPVELMARVQKTKELAEKQQAIAAKTDAEYRQDETLIDVYDDKDGSRIHIFYSIALMLCCPVSKVHEYNLNMMKDVVYMTSHDMLKFPIPDDKNWHGINGREKPTNWVMDTHGVCFQPMTTKLFRQFNGQVDNMLSLAGKNAVVHMDNKSAVFFVRTGDVSEPFTVTFYLWAASKDSRKLLRRSCNFCAKTRENYTFLCCNGCKRIYYCSPECQKKGWNSHRQICNEIRNDVGSL
tara:strand:- start:32999 stop:34012 length:1014 start_codon:yes stop_codon:yes gene_type:complete